MTSQVIAKRYAKAFFEVAREHDKLKAYGDELAHIAKFLVDNQELKHALLNPAIGIVEKKDLWSTILKRLELAPMSYNFLMVLMDHSRLSQLEGVVTSYFELLDEEQGIKRATVKIAAPLKEDILQRLTKSLEALAKARIIVDVKEDPSLIGGLTAQIGDLVFDGSVKNELARLKDSLTRGN